MKQKDVQHINFKLLNKMEKEHLMKFSSQTP